MVRVSGISPPVHLFGFNNDIKTLTRGVLERVFYVKTENGFETPPVPAPGYFASTLKSVFKELSEILPSAAPMTRREFVDKYRGHKRRTYELAFASLLRDGGICLKDITARVFTKYEKTNFSAKADPVARVVSPFSARYNLEVGRYIKAIECRVLKALGRLFDHPTVFKGMNSARSGKLLYEKWGMFKNPVALGLDAKRFDQHVSQDALFWEFGIYRACFKTKKHKKQLNKLLSAQVAAKCVGYCDTGRIKYSVTGSRLSGVPNTGLGNCVLMCSMIRAYASSIGVKIALANNGDDCVVFMENEDLAIFTKGLDKWFVKMGFNMVAEVPCYTFEQIEFCQTHPVWVGPAPDDYIMVRHPKNAIAKDTAWLEPVLKPSFNADHFRGWLDAVGKGGMALAGGIPVFQDFYGLYCRYGSSKVVLTKQQSWGVRALQEGMTRQYGEIAPRTRASFYWAFGVTPCEQIVLEEFYRDSTITYDLVEKLTYQPDLPI